MNQRSCEPPMTDTLLMSPGPGTNGQPVGQYCVLVNSCDSYADCWGPFFTLFAHYWPRRVPRIYLNTETLSYSYPGLDIIPLGVASHAGLAWSARVMGCLDRIPEPVVLYMQEDYFLKAPVDVPFVERCVADMLAHAVTHVSLHPSACWSPSEASSLPHLSVVPRRAQYRISTQAGLWLRPALRSYMRKHENVWELEWYGTRRAWRRRDTFLHVNPDYITANGNDPVPYDPTGIGHGRWARDVVEELFAEHDIPVDFSRRGFYKEEGGDRRRPPRPYRALRRLRSIL